MSKLQAANLEGGAARQVLLENAFIAWWIATTASCAWLLVTLPAWLAPVAGKHRFTVMVVLVACWVLALYAVGKSLDINTQRRFSEGYPPFRAKPLTVVLFVAAVAGLVIVPLEIWSAY